LGQSCAAAYRDRASNMNRRRMIRRGAPYGPPLPEGAPDDGVDRGIAAFIICASLVRQFEFAENVWINDRTFHELGNERDPICGTQDGRLEFKIPNRPIRRVLTGLPAFTTLRGGAYFFLPGINAMRPPILDMPLEIHCRMIDINARAYTNLIHRFGREMRDRGRGRSSS
jgi:deferrochelatase/peroxidase EfeB